MILDGEHIEDLLWENGLDFEFMTINGVDTMLINFGSTYLGIESVWNDTDENPGWFFDVNDITFKTGSPGTMGIFGSSDATTGEELVQEIINLQENIS